MRVGGKVGSDEDSKHSDLFMAAAGSHSKTTTGTTAGSATRSATGTATGTATKIPIDVLLAAAEAVDTTASGDDATSRRFAPFSVTLKKEGSANVCAVYSNGSAPDSSSVDSDTTSHADDEEMIPGDPGSPQANKSLILLFGMLFPNLESVFKEDGGRLLVSNFNAEHLVAAIRRDCGALLTAATTIEAVTGGAGRSGLRVCKYQLVSALMKTRRFAKTEFFEMLKEQRGFDYEGNEKKYGRFRLC